MTTAEREAFVVRLPQMLRLGLWHFRGLDPERREDRTWAAIELAWKHYVALCERGRADLLMSAFGYAVRQSRCGRDVARTGREPVHAVSLGLDAPDIPDRRPTVDHEVAIRLDVSSWLDSLGPVDRAVAVMLSGGATTNDAACSLGVTAPAVSMRRAKLARSWRAHAVA